MFTVIETPTFSRLCLDYWTEDERGAFAAWIAANPESSVVIKGSGGCRKVRWSRPGVGRRSGVRIIHFNELDDGRIYLLLNLCQKCQRQRAGERPIENQGGTPCP